jgi:hypothetical protein
MSEIARIPRRRTTAIALIEPPAGPLSDSLLNFVGRAMADPTIDAGKLEVLVRLQREIVADDARLRFNRAMSAAQGEMAPIVRDARNASTSSRYAKLETIDAAIRPIYVRHGFHLSFNSEVTGGPSQRIVCDVAHEAGHVKPVSLDAGLDLSGSKGKPNKTELHGLGSTISYLRRYLTCMVFNLVLTDEDNDGNRVRAGAEDRDDGELAGASQAAELYTLLRDCSTSPAAEAERALLGKMNLGHLRSLKDVPAGDFGRVRNALISKRARIRDAAALKIQAGDIK